MLKEFFSAIVDLAQSGQKSTIQSIDDGQTLLIDEPTKGVRERKTKRAVLPKFSSVSAPSDLAAALLLHIPLAREIGEQYGLNLDRDLPALVSVGEREISATTDVETNAARFVCNLPFSPVFQTLFDLMVRDGRAFDQRDLLKFLRVDLHLAGAESMVPKFRKLTWNRSASSGGALNHADESLGKSIERKVNAGVDVPEGFTITTPVYACPELKSIVAKIEVVVTLNFETEEIELDVPRPQIVKALESAKDALRDHVRGELLKLAESDLGQQVNFTVVRSPEPQNNAMVINVEDHS